MIGLIVFMILITINFIVITKGATRIAEVGARFTLDAIPGKQMSIDADLSAGIIDEKEAQRRRRELEEESSFFGSMDGASKFVRGDAIAGLIITAINIVRRHHHRLFPARHADRRSRRRLRQALRRRRPRHRRSRPSIVSLAAGLLVSKGGTRGSTDQAVFGQLGGYPRALSRVGLLLIVVLGLMPGLPMLPFLVLGSLPALPQLRSSRAARPASPRRRTQAEQEKAGAARTRKTRLRQSIAAHRRDRACLGKQLSTSSARTRNSPSASARCARSSPRSTASSFPDVKLTDDFTIAGKSYQIKVHGYGRRGTPSCASASPGRRRRRPRRPDMPGDEVREPAFGMPAVSVPEMFTRDLQARGFRLSTTCRCCSPICAK